MKVQKKQQFGVAGKLFASLQDKPRCSQLVILGILFLCLMSIMTIRAAANSGVISIVSTSSEGVRADGYSTNPSISSDGRFVAFESDASNLVSGDTNGARDIFVKDTQTGTTMKVSTNSEGVQADAYSLEPSVSADGRYVAFTSYADNLVSGDTNGLADIFVKDTQNGTVMLVSINQSGVQADAYSLEPSISADGRYVAFTSYADNLGPSNTNGYHDVFVKDTETGNVLLVSTGSEGQGNYMSGQPSISANGRYVAFTSLAFNLVPGDPYNWISYSDVFVKDTLTGNIELVSGQAPDNFGDNVSNKPSISADGRYVAFRSLACNLVTTDFCIPIGYADIFVKDMKTGNILMASSDAGGNAGNNSSNMPSISPDGRYVSFKSGANDLVSGDYNNWADIFVKNMQNGQIDLVSTDSAGNQANSYSEQTSISLGGRYTAFKSYASNLVPGDTNNTADIFLSEITGICSGIKPSLTLEKANVYWASFADYETGNLSVDFIVKNNGSDSAYNVRILSTTATNGVTFSSSLPLIGSTSMLTTLLPLQAIASITIEYSVPPGVGSFRATVSASTLDGCGNSYTYP